MGLEHTWRWFGPKDPITLKEIKQTGAAGVVTALHQIPAGEIWSVDEITKRKNLIESAGLRWSVAESVPVHEDIKKGQGNYRKFIENYKESIRNLGKCGIDIICYNFMPVLDWSRTDLEVVFRDGSITTKFEANVFAAFDLFILARPGTENDYNEEQIHHARQYYENLSASQKDRLVQSVLLGFPGSGDAYTLEELKAALVEYRTIGETELRENLCSFIKEIVPVAEESRC
jgi:mannonate dehydratase